MTNGDYDDWFKKLGDSIENISNMPRPRYIKSHLPWDLLPKQLDEKKPKVKKNAQVEKHTTFFLYLSLSHRYFVDHLRREKSKRHLRQFLSLFENVSRHEGMLQRLRRANATR